VGFLDGFLSLGANRNKVDESDIQQEGVVSSEFPELKLKMEDEELIELKNVWLKNWLNYSAPYKERIKTVKNYWLGKHYNSYAIDERPLADNLIFEALETFLPIATKDNPDATVEADGGMKGRLIAKKVRSTLIYLADILNVKQIIKKTARHWAINFIGCVKVGFSTRENDITAKVIPPAKLILDPKGTVVNGFFTGKYIGEYRTDSLSVLKKKFPKSKEYLDSMMGGDDDIEISYIEWWTDDFTFWTLNDEVLDKTKNPHFNYPSDKVSIDEMGMERSQKDVPGQNHFNRPRMPYVFLSVFNLDNGPLDDTSLIEQNLSLQDLINKRLVQMDKNADGTNGGTVVSGDHFTKEEASKVGEALRRGLTVYVPSGDVQRAFKREMGMPLPQFVYQSLVDYRNELRNIFGVRGSSLQGMQSEDTVRGKMISKGQDQDRIGGGVSSFIEAMVDALYNQFVQLMYVYYDEAHLSAVLGNETEQEFVSLSSAELTEKLVISVRPGSLIPRDTASQRAEAIQLWQLGALDPITLFTELEYPNAKEMAKNLYLWKANPAMLFPDVQLPLPMGPEGIPSPVPQRGEPGEGRQLEPEQTSGSNMNQSLKSIPLPKA
jgi:hypothetical protein